MAAIYGNVCSIGGNTMFKKYFKTPLVVGLIAAFIVFSDSQITPWLAPGKNFAWIGFISWTVFFVSPLRERVKAIPAYCIGFLAANLIIYLGGVFSNWGIIAFLAATLASALVNFLIMFFEHAKKIFLDCMSGIFVGISATFGIFGTGIPIWSGTTISIVVIYGIIGLLSGFMFDKTCRKIL